MINEYQACLFFFEMGDEKNRQANGIEVKLRGIEDGAELGSGEGTVGFVRDLCPEDGHTLEIPEEVDALDAHRVEVCFPQFARKSSIAIVDGIADAPQVLEAVVGRAAVDMVDGHAGRDLPYPSAIHRSRGKDGLATSERILEFQIIC